MRKRDFWVGLGISIFFLVGTVWAQSEEPAKVINLGLEPELSEKLSEYAKQGMKKWQAPGLAIGIVKGDRLVWSGYFGWADLMGEKKPVDENSVFIIGSVSKTFTAIGIMQQWEQGKFQLTDSVNQYAPYPLFKPEKPGCREVTFLDVLTHLSGGGEFMSYRQLGNLLPTVVLLPGEERPPLKAIYPDGIRPRICPGTKWAYCNFCFGALGLVLENLSGQSFDAYMDEHILKPLGMRMSHFYETKEILKNLARGYTGGRSGFVPLPPLRYPVTPMGGMYSTVNDMSRYMIALLNQGKLGDFQLLKPETLALMTTPKYQVDSRLEKIGLCFFIEENLFGHKVFGHDGAMPGYGTLLSIAPEDKLGVIVFANIMNASAYEIGHGILKILFNYQKPELIFKEAKELWQGFIGDYGSIEPEFLSDYRFVMRNLGIYKVRIKKDGLWLESARIAKPKRLRQVKPGDPYFYEIIVPESEIPRYLVFVPGEDGKAKSIKIGLNEYVRLEGEAKTRAYLKALAFALIPPIF